MNRQAFELISILADELVDEIVDEIVDRFGIVVKDEENLQMRKKLVKNTLLADLQDLAESATLDPTVASPEDCPERGDESGKQR